MENSNKSDKLKTMWKHPWGYKEGFAISAGLLVVGFLLEIVSQGRGISLFQFPLNIIIVIVFINAIVLSYFFGKKNPIIRWLSSVPAAVSAMSLVTFLVLILGFTSQDDANTGTISKLLGFSHVTTSYPFVLSQVFLFISLGLVTMRRSFPLTKRNIGFLLNHAGLWITLISASMGAGDLKRLHMNLEEGKDFTNIAVDANNQAYKLTIFFKLTKFNIEQYNPKLLLVDNVSQRVITENQKAFNEISAGLKTNIIGWDITVKEYIKSAIRIKKDSNIIKKGNQNVDSVKQDVDDNAYTYVENNQQVGSMPAAYVIAKKNGTTVEGWISCGSFMFPFVPLVLNNNISIAMGTPEPKKYSSNLKFISMDGTKDSIILEVNKPAKIANWKVYQIGYDEKMGRWSTLSVVELVSDPWLPFVYLGIFMLIAGGIYLFWLGKRPEAIETTK